MQPEKDSRVESQTPATGGNAKTSHTPTPWRCDPDGYAEYIWGASGEMVAQLRGHGAGLPKRANAEFIVRACNNFDALLEALKLAFSYSRAKECMDPQAVDLIREAIANAEATHAA